MVTHGCGHSSTSTSFVTSSSHTWLRSFKYEYFVRHILLKSHPLQKHGCGHSSTRTLFVTSSSRHILPTTVTFTLTLVLSLHCDGWRLLLLLLYFVHGTAGLQRDEKLRLSVYPCGACFLFVTSSGHSSNLHILPTTVTFTLTLRRLFVHFVDRGVAKAASNRNTG